MHLLRKPGLPIPEAYRKADGFGFGYICIDCGWVLFGKHDAKARIKGTVYTRHQSIKLKHERDRHLLNDVVVRSHLETQGFSSETQ
jgi:hypothetical protein